MIGPARGILSFSKGSDSPTKGVACYFFIAAFVTFCGRCHGRSETQRVPGGEKGSPSIPILSVYYLSWYGSDGIQLSGPDVLQSQPMLRSW